MPLPEEAAGHPEGEEQQQKQQKQQQKGRISTTGISRAEAKAALSRLDRILPKSVHVLAQESAWLWLQGDMEYAQGVLLPPTGFAVANGPILYEAYSEVMSMEPSSASSAASGAQSEILFDPADMCDTTALRSRLLVDSTCRKCQSSSCAQ